MYVTGTQMAEVEADTETGVVRVLRVVAAHDVGRPAFLEGVVGQIEGGIAMGVGFALTEDFVPGETSGFKQYRIPRTRDVPEMVTILVGGPGSARDTDEPPELQLKGVAECSNMVAAPAIANAIAHATGQRVVQLPARPVATPGLSPRRGR
jgi:CO/xanthine dehydrogenase Mo-binding subunit